MTTTLPPARLALTVGQVLYHWSRSSLLHFYADLADGPADTIVLGEAVCARRRELRLDDWLALGRELSAAGKDVVLATQTLIESEADELDVIADLDEVVRFEIAVDEPEVV